MSVSDHKGIYGLNDTILGSAVKEIMFKVKIDHTHDVPYTGSSNKALTKVYVDYLLPRYLMHKGKRYDIFPMIVTHEVVEALLERFGLTYLYAHQIATRAEESVCVAQGLPWDVYDGWIQPWIKKIGARKSYPNVPKDLNEEPETDLHDKATLARMRTR